MKLDLDKLRNHVIHGDCRVIMTGFPDNSFDAVICDPPYDLTAGKKGGSGVASMDLSSPQGRARIGTGFMGLGWDATGIAFDPATWVEVLRILKPGGHLLAMGGSRTYHRLVKELGFGYIGIEAEAEYINIAKQRLA